MSTQTIAFVELAVRSDNPDFDHPERAVASFTVTEVEKWKKLAAILKDEDAHPIHIHDYRCDFFTFDVNQEDEDQWVESDFNQEASTLFVTRDGIQWRGYEKHNDSGSVWTTERTTFEKLDALLAQGAKRYDWNALCDLWNQLADTPVTADGLRLDQGFIHFPIGTSVHTVWHWFEAQNSDFIVGEVGSRIGAGHPYRKLHQSSENKAETLV